MSANNNKTIDERAIRDLVENWQKQFAPRISMGFLPITLRKS